MRDVEPCHRLVATGRNLFQRAIIHGGSALSTWSITDDPLVYARRLSDRVNCTASVDGGGAGGGVYVTSSHRHATSLMHTADLLRCLKHRSADQLVCMTDCAPKTTNHQPTAPTRSQLQLIFHSVACHRRRRRRST